MSPLTRGSLPARLALAPDAMNLRDGLQTADCAP